MDYSFVRFVGFGDRVFCLLKVSIVKGAGKIVCVDEDRRFRNFDNFFTVAIGVFNRF